MSAAPETSRAWPIVSLIVLFILGAFNIIVLLFVVPTVEHIFHRTMPGKPMPGITLFIFAARIPLTLITLAWPIGGIIAFWLRSRAGIWIVSLGQLFCVALIGATLIALFCPLIPIIAAISDASVTSPAASY